MDGRPPVNENENDTAEEGFVAPVVVDPVAEGVSFVNCLLTALKKSIRVREHRNNVS